MTDLVKRLRDWVHVHPEDYNKPAGHLYEKAADRIEALEAALRRLDYWAAALDADREVLDAMTTDEWDDHMRQLQMIRDALISGPS